MLFCFHAKSSRKLAKSSKKLKFFSQRVIFFSWERLFLLAGLAVDEGCIGLEFHNNFILHLPDIDCFGVGHRRKSGGYGGRLGGHCQ
jgi:hypothetical protein